MQEQKLKEKIELREPTITAELQGRSIKEIPQEFKRWFIKTFGENTDRIDVLHEYDRGISVGENMMQFKEKFGVLIEDKLKEQVEKTKGGKSRSETETENKLREQEREVIKKWKKNNFQNIDVKSFDVPKALVRLICNRISLLKGVTLIGETSLGKTMLTLSTIKEEKCAEICKFENTYTTPLELYKLLYRYQKEYEKKQKTNKPFFIIIFDDVEGLLTDKKSIAILKSALWETNGQRIIKMNTIDRLLGDVSKVFEFTGHIIILANHLNLKDANINAVKERTHYFELRFKYAEKLKIMSEIVKVEYANTTLELRQKALEILIRNTDLTTADFNFRTLIRVYDYMVYGEEETERLLKSTLKVDEKLTFILGLIDNERVVSKEIEQLRGKTTEEQACEFALRFDSSRPSFFRMKKKLMEMM